jgi:hypothetical protein
MTHVYVPLGPPVRSAPVSGPTPEAVQAAQDRAAAAETARADRNALVKQFTDFKTSAEGAAADALEARRVATLAFDLEGALSASARYLAALDVAAAVRGVAAVAIPPTPFRPF